MQTFLQDDKLFLLKYVALYCMILRNPTIFNSCN